ncbi:hypothetical protein J6590_000389 [Homalodisca vitripennis]|nr:hypothetical protein J6590_000389 [Homalodisca vitripennis]
MRSLERKRLFGDDVEVFGDLTDEDNLASVQPSNPQDDAAKDDARAESDQPELLSRNHMKPSSNSFKNKVFNKALMEAKSALQTLTSDDTVQSDIIFKQDNYKSKDDHLRDQRDIQNSFHLPHFSQDTFKNPDCENTLEQSTAKISLGNVVEKINNYRELEEMDLERSLTLAAEVGNALLLENTQLKQDTNRLLSQITELV